MVNFKKTIIKVSAVLLCIYYLYFGSFIVFQVLRLFSPTYQLINNTFFESVFWGESSMFYFGWSAISGLTSAGIYILLSENRNSKKTAYILTSVVIVFLAAYLSFYL